MKFQLAFAAFLAFASLMWGQIGGGSIVGSVTDASGASIAGVQISARNLDTNVVQQTRTNGQGYYEFPLLPPESITWKRRNQVFSGPSARTSNCTPAPVRAWIFK